MATKPRDVAPDGMQCGREDVAAPDELVQHREVVPFASISPKFRRKVACYFPRLELTSEIVVSAMIELPVGGRSVALSA